MASLGRKATWLIAALAGFGLAGLSGPARSADLPPPAPAPVAPFALPPLPYFVRLGVTAVISDTHADARFGGAPFPGSGASVGTVPAAYLETGVYVTNAIAISLAGGYPPTFTSTGTGTLKPFGTLYKSVVGLPVLEATYHLDMFGPVRPYAGVGFGYAIVFDNKPAAVRSPNLRDQAAFVLVGGIDYAITDHWGVFVDVKKAFLSQRFTGTATPFLPNPTTVAVTASVRTDPLLVTAGASYRF